MLLIEAVAAAARRALGIDRRSVRRPQPRPGRSISWPALPRGAVLAGCFFVDWLNAEILHLAA
jgi:hypothetical protein